jgi:peptidoglycan/LPS O-acetylase OafA/YrhL
MSHLGEISYSIYMVHFPLILAVHLVAVGFGLRVPYDSWLYFVAFLAALVAAASATYRFIELPGKRLLSLTALAGPRIRRR